MRERSDETRRCVIVGGADINRPDRIRAYLRPDDFVICCDSGLKHRDALDIRADLIVGDFDSHADPHIDIETIVLPRAKDDTDTFFAVKEGLRRGFRDFLLLGVMGGRMDHSLGNISALLLIDHEGCCGIAVDDYAEFRVVGHDPAIVPDSFPYFSTISVDGTARGVCIRNAKFPLDDAVIEPWYQYGISNEVLAGETAKVSVREGRLLLICDFDK